MPVRALTFGTFVMVVCALAWACSHTGAWHTGTRASVGSAGSVGSVVSAPDRTVAALRADDRETSSLAAGMPSPSPSPSGGAPSAERTTRGMWVWGTRARLERDDGTAELLVSCRQAGLNEVYLSVGQVLDDPRLPALVTALHDAGMRVEALMGDAGWYRPEEHATMLAYVDGVGAYNARTPASSHFAAIHLDIEPHQLPANRGRRGFLPALVTTLARARTRAAELGLETSADLPRFALDEQGPAFAAVVPRIFLMLYELRDRSAAGLVNASRRVFDETYEGLAADRPGALVVGVRAEDYGADLEATIDLSSRALAGARASADVGGSRSRYAGWAIHDERSYRARVPGR